MCVYVLYVHPGGKEKSQSPPLLGAFAQEEDRPCVALFIKLFLASAIDRAGVVLCLVTFGEENEAQAAIVN